MSEKCFFLNIAITLVGKFVFLPWMLNWIRPSYNMPINQVQNLQKQLAQLKEEAKVNRIPVSEAVKDLLSYISQNIHEDSLVNGINQSNNPFIPKSPCSIMWKMTGYHFLPSTHRTMRSHHCDFSRPPQVSVIQVFVLYRYRNTLFSCSLWS